MAYTTPIMTTVTKAANKEKTPKEADAALKVNILDFCEEHYEDILPVILDKICRDKRKEVHARLDFGENSKKSRRVVEGRAHSTDLAILTRQGQLSLGLAGKTLGIDLTVEIVLADGTLVLADIVLEAETAFATSNSHMVKEKKENDKIRTKPDKNGKRGKARQCRSPVTVKKAEKEKKIQTQGTTNGNPKVVLHSRNNTRAEITIYPKMNSKGQDCQDVKDVRHKDGTCNSVYNSEGLFVFIFKLTTQQGLTMKVLAYHRDQR
nr:hypothetical protein [Tanacetum cinerariifolium]